MNRVRGWFLNTHREWVEFIIVTVVLWLVMIVAISGLDLRTVG
jgi:nitrate reductase NapE component